MDDKLLPRYPIYIISKGRWDTGLTAKFLIKDGVPFHLVVEPQEYDFYAAVFGEERLLVLPFSNLGQGSIPARNWVWEHAKASGTFRHWIFDDNIKSIKRRHQGKRITSPAGIALYATEDFTDRYENIALTGLNYAMFAFICDGKRGIPPFHLNCRVYSAILIKNDLPFRWRGRYNEDADLSLQVLSNKWCTILMNAFLIDKVATMTMKGGNTDELYQGSGRYDMARELERMWPGVVEVRHKFGRAQHSVKYAWQRFDTPLIRKKDVDFAALTPNEFGMRLIDTRETDV